MPMSADEFWQLPEDGVRRELVRGEVIKSVPPGGRHGAISVTLASLLWSWVKSHGGGYVGVEAGYVLARSPDTVRGPDISYVRQERIPATGIPEGFWNLAPDLAVEVISPSETADQVRGKVRDCLDAGTPLVWTIYPRSREVVAHNPDGVARTFAGDTVLKFPEELPGFHCSVADLFD